MRTFCTAGILALAIIISLVSCNPNSHFDEYIGVNLIENRGFDSGNWVIDYGKTEPFAYVNFMDASGDSAAPTGGTSADTNPWRLEIVNLIPNGDFESTVPPAAPSGWVANGTAILASDGFDVINDNTLDFSISDPTSDYIDFDILDGLNGLLDSAVANATYLVRYDLKVPSAGPKYFEYRDGDGVTGWGMTITNIAVVHDIPADYAESINTEFAFDTASSLFTIGTSLGAGGVQTGYIDNLRVTRTDLKHEITLSLMYEDASQIAGDALPLLPGTYRLTVYAKKDPTTTYSGTGSEQDNRFDPSGITFGIRSINNGVVSGIRRTSYPLSSLDGTNWTELSASFDTSTTLEIPLNATDQVLELFIESTDRTLGQNSRDIGSILIAEPALEFTPDVD